MLLMYIQNKNMVNDESNGSVAQPFTVLLTRLRLRAAVRGDDAAPVSLTEDVLGIGTLLCTITSTTFCKHSNIT